MLLTSQQNFHLKAAFFQGKTGKNCQNLKEIFKNYQNYMDK